MTADKIYQNFGLNKRENASITTKSAGLPYEIEKVDTSQRYGDDYVLSIDLKSTDERLKANHFIIGSEFAGKFIEDMGAKNAESLIGKKVLLFNEEEIVKGVSPLRY